MKKGIICILIIILFITISIPSMGKMNEKLNDRLSVYIYSPPNPPIIEGPLYGIVNQPLIYNFTITDPHNSTMDVLDIRWGYGPGLRWLAGEEPWTNGTILSVPHAWEKSGRYGIVAKVWGQYGQSEWSSPLFVTISSPGNDPPDKSAKPSGPLSGKAGKEHTYSTSTTDPDGDQVWYKWDWGDEVSNWDGPYDSGDTVTASHIWDEKGDYSIKVKAKDVHGEESPWSDPLPITMPKNKVFNPFLLFLERIMERFPILEQILQLIDVYLG
jgi:PKD domain